VKSLGAPVATVGVTAGVHGFPAVLTSFVGRSLSWMRSRIYWPGTEW
jgi:hypothetical protein